MKAIDLKNIIKREKFITDLLQIDNCVIYFVGGINRDHILNKNSKDADIVVCGVPLWKVIETIKPHGKVNTDSANTGVIKLSLKHLPHIEDVDICLPRTEKSGKTARYNDFVINADHNLPIESDLIRRDFRFNAIAQNVLTDDWIDPLGGRDDIKQGIIRMISERAFKEDALRMLRAIKFSSRFGFNMTIDTLEAIKRNAYLINNAPKERILKEITDIFNRGDASIGLEMLRVTNLFEHIFGYKSAANYDLLLDIKLECDFFYVMLQRKDNDTPHTLTLYSKIYQNSLKGDNKMFKKLSILDKLFNTLKGLQLDNNLDKIIKIRILIADICMDGGYQLLLNSGIVPNFIKEELLNMENKNMPLTNNELSINGNDLISIGLKQGYQIGWWLKEIRTLIYKELLINDKSIILQYIKNVKQL